MKVSLLVFILLPVLIAGRTTLKIAHKAGESLLIIDILTLALNLKLLDYKLLG